MHIVGSLLALPVTLRAWVITLECPLSTQPQHHPTSRNKGLCTLHQICRQIHSARKKKTLESEGGYCYKVATFTVSKTTKASRVDEVDTKVNNPSICNHKGGCIHAVW